MAMGNRDINIFLTFDTIFFMKITMSIDGYRLGLSAQELAQIVIASFFIKLFTNRNLHDKPYDSKEVKDFISTLAKNSVNSKEYEYYTAMLDLYHAFEKNCSFSFKLKRNFDPHRDSIKTVEDIEKFKDDPPDIIVRHKQCDYPFELKRYRGKISFNDIFNFLKKKIIDHYYSEKQNFLIILQPSSGSKVDLNTFKQIHEKLKNEKNQPGYIGLTFNHDNMEIITVRVFPNLDRYTRPYNSEKDLFTNLLFP